MRKSLILLALLPALPCYAQNNLKSAREIIGAPVKTATSENTSSVSTRPVAPAVLAWRREVWKFRQSSAKNSATQNAADWLLLSKRRLEIPARDAEGQPQRVPAFREVVEALPSPNNWPELLKQARANFTLEPNQANATSFYFAARLQNDKQGQIEALRALHRIVAPRANAAWAKYPLPKAGSRVQNNYEVVEKQRSDFGDIKNLAALLVDSPDIAQQIVGIRWQVAMAARLGQYDTYDVPDLLTSWGAKTATPVIQEILQSPARLQWYEAGKTADLASRLWLSNPKIQAFPQWDLATYSSNWRLSQAMLQKHPRVPGAENAWSAQYARSQILNGLLTSGKTTEATQKVDSWLKVKGSQTDIDFPTVDAAEPVAVQLRKLQWIESTLQKHPQLDWWTAYGYLSLRLGKTPQRLALLKNLVGQSNFNQLPAKGRHTYLETLASAYLDSNDVPNGGNALVRALEVAVAGADLQNELEEDVTALLRLNRVASHAKWMQAAQKGARVLLTHYANQGDSESASKLTRVAMRFAEQKQIPFAQSLLVTALKQTQRKPEDSQYYLDVDNATQPYLYGLTQIFYRANRPNDVVYLLQNAQGWGQNELTPLLTLNGVDEWEYDVENPETKTPPRLGYITAWALAKTHRRAEAARITRALLEREGSYDAAYRLLCDLEGEAARPFLKKLAAADRYEERPLIWQAFLSRRTEKWAEAQQLARQAIAIDPSDGEQGPGDRLRAYAELAAALRGQKQEAEAAKIENAVRSIRLAESADYLRMAGLTTQAIALYKKSLSYFDDAYCIQSRLAVQFVGLGRHEEAARHFRRAYELMPVSFGRMESHCFGCQGVFGGKQQNSIARQVFTQLEKARPNDAKVAYLSGYWRMTAGQHKEAVKYFERAVKLDPLYLSAWKQLSYMKNELSPVQSDRVTLALIRLDPRGRHSGGGWEGVGFHVEGDYRGLWQTAQSVLPRKAPLTKANFKLMASSSQATSEDSDSWQFVKKPADAISRQPFVDFVGNLMQ